MWIKAGILGDPGTRCSNLAVWTMAGLGITIGLYSCRKWVEYSIRKRDVLAREENDNCIDRLSDDILCDIVLRFGTLEASRTSILSRRWRNIWTMNPELFFTCTLDLSKRYHDDVHDHVAYGDRRRFLKAVDKCLRLYSGRNLTFFFLHCCFLNDHPGHLVRWMQTLARFNIENLYLGVSCRTCDGTLRWVLREKPFTFSFKLIDGFSRLKYLHLMRCYVETTFVSQCNSLMTLTLQTISVLSHQLSDILMSCPNLTSLRIEHCDLPPNLRISGPNLKLKSLKLSDCYNVQKVEISDINIESIKIDIHSEVEVLLFSVPKLEKLYLRTPGMNYSFADAPRQMPELKHLWVQPKYQTEIVGLPPTFQVFGNVRILHLTTVKEVDLRNFAPVMVECPLLEKFYLLVGGPTCKEERKGQWPVLRHKHLEHMEWCGFSGTRNELGFAKFIATSAQVLQTLVLRLHCRGYDAKQIDPGVALTYLLKNDFLSEHAALDFELPEKYI